MRLLLCLVSALATLPAADADRDGLSDKLEQQLLERFRPRFTLSPTECDGLPAEFLPGAQPTVKVRNGTLYGQATPRDGGALELRWFHLWGQDCGLKGHPLDAEHVSAWLVKDAKGRWQARYWYAAAHEDTVCDASHGGRADVLDAVAQGPRVWISRGKHASFLSQDACRRGCGGDRCETGAALPRGRIINLGERGHPMNGAAWIASRRWDFDAKLETDFPPAALARLESSTELVALGPGLRPMQVAIGGANTALGHTGNALSTAGNHTEGSLALSAEKVSGSLKTAKDKTVRWIRARTGL